MTVGEFAKKYKVEYQTVRAATYRTATREKEPWALDFPEDELRRAVLQELRTKKEWHRERLERIDGQLESVRKKRRRTA